MAGELDLLLIQSGLESTWGTNVASTVKLMGMTDLELDPGVEQKPLPDQRGSLAPGHESQITMIAPKGSYGGWASYEDIHYWLEGMVGAVAPSGGGPYTRAGAAPLAAQITGRAQTLVYGGPEGIYGINGALPTTFVFEVNTSEEAKFSGDLIGKDRVIDTLDALSDRVVTPIMADHVKIYLDAVGGTIGATEMAALGFSVELTVEANRSGKHHLSALTASGVRGPRWSGALKAVLELDATIVNPLMDELFTVKASIANFEKQVRIACISGTDTLLLDFAGFQEAAPVAFTDEDGIVTVELNLTGKYNAALANWFKYTGDNDVSALP